MIRDINTRRKPSLRYKLLRHVLWPLVITWALGSAVVIGFAYYFTTQAYDRSLLDDAYALSAQVRSDPVSGLSLNLTDAEMRAVLFDQAESNYFALWRADGRLLAGHVALGPPSTSLATNDGYVVDATGAPRWIDGAYLGRSVRIVSLVRSTPAPFVVVVAQTTDSRNRLLSRLLMAAVIPQVILLLFLAWWLRRKVGQDLRPLSDLRHAVEQRDVADLRHVPEELTRGAKTMDVEHLSQAMNSLFDRLQLGIAAQREFSGNVAHELRTPLAGIRLQAEHALTLTSDADVQSRMKKLLVSADHASHLIDQLLALAFADEARHTVPLAALNLTDIVREATLRHLSRADSLRVDLGAEGVEGENASQPLLVLAHRVLVDAVLDNLIDNAFRYGRGSLPQKITVGVRKMGTEILLTVTDNGPGLSSEEASLYKHRWAQASGSGHAPQIGRGVGLGLAIVSRYADLLNAKLVLEPAQPVQRQGNGLSVDAGLRAGLVFDLATQRD